MTIALIAIAFLAGALFTAYNYEMRDRQKQSSNQPISKSSNHQIK